MKFEAAAIALFTLTLACGPAWAQEEDAFLNEGRSEQYFPKSFWKSSEDIYKPASPPAYSHDEDAWTARAIQEQPANNSSYSQ